MQAQASLKKIIFFQRLAFICGLLFLISVAIRFTHIDEYLPQPLIEIAALLGWFLSPVAEFISFIIILFYLIRFRTLLQPVWLSVANIILFILEILIYTRL